jgi:pyruvate dehydrogenase E2 component (dihydrolipoamide acetyltransferase)
MAEIAIPSIGIAMTEALLLKWLKEPGDEVAQSEPVAEIETDKATMELESPIAGRLGPHLAEAGAILAVGTVIAEVLGAGERAAEREEATPSASASVEASVVGPVRVEPPPAPSAPRAPDERRPHATSPRHRRVARDAGPETQTADRFRALIADKVAQSWREIPHFAVSREVDAEALLAELGKLRTSGVEPTPTLTDLLLRALALALRERGSGTGDVGLAVATPYGVMIPVVHNVLELDPASLARSRVAAVERARAGRLSPEDLETVVPSTLSNLGAFGIDRFTGIIAIGQVSLLTVGRAVPRVVAGDDRTLTITTTFDATLNADHRTVDGADAARLLVAFADAAEHMGAVG